ncbi:MAG: polysaccharide biosynthesis/export family protein [Crocinitomicaceae bacterium]|nr:polysaccharide biosynthesis/export family protein [Crocinitomicaceae bacterium]
MYKLLFWVVMALFLGSCNINKDLMFRTDRDFVFDEIDMISETDSSKRDTMRVDTSYLGWRISPLDMISMQLYSNQGNMLTDFLTSSVDRLRPGAAANTNYVLDTRGYVELPVIGRQKLAGMTLFEAQNYLEKKYESTVIEPYCLLTILNHRVIVFSGSGSTGSVINIGNQNVSVIEAIALAGGIRERGNASKVKIIRTFGGQEKIYRINLATIEGAKYVHLPVQAGDIIYVEPVPRITSEFAQSIAPAIGLFNTFLILYFMTKGI